MMTGMGDGYGHVPVFWAGLNPTPFFILRGIAVAS